jgi:hypothetical protein
VVSLRTTSFNVQDSTWCSLRVECFVRISEQTATCALYVINWLVFITVVYSVYSAVRTYSLYKADYVSSVRVKVNWLGLLVFRTVVYSVYSAVRNYSSYKADYVSSVRVKVNWLGLVMEKQLFFFEVTQSGTSRRWQYNTVLAHCMLDTEGWDTHSEYAILIAFPRQLLHECASLLLYAYIACLVLRRDYLFVLCAWM